MSVRLVDVGKRYVKYEDVPLLISQAFRLRAGNRRSHLWALRHVSAEVPQGHALGVIGRNGSGKSTMLRMLAGVTAPTEGTVTVRGRVAPLVAIGVGFHPELTGRENVYVNGTILGLSRKDIDRRFEAIVDFADITGFIDTPVKFYSSGMFVRLGFSVAVASTPDVLLIDEVLAVGDVAFQQRCFDRMAEIREDGTTILVVSHNLASIRRICSEVLVLHDGTPRFLGETEEAITLFQELLGQSERAREASSDLPCEITSFQLIGSNGPTKHVAVGEEATFRMDVLFRRALDRPAFVFRVVADNGQLVYGDRINWDQSRRFEAGERVRFEVTLPVRLSNGPYNAHGRVQWGEMGRDVASTGPRMFFVKGRKGVRGVADLGGTLSVEPLPEPMGDEPERRGDAPEPDFGLQSPTGAPIAGREADRA